MTTPTNTVKRSSAVDAIIEGARVAPPPVGTYFREMRALQPRVGIYETVVRELGPARQTLPAGVDFMLKALDVPGTADPVARQRARSVDARAIKGIDAAARLHLLGKSGGNKYDGKLVVELQNELNKSGLLDKLTPVHPWPGAGLFEAFDAALAKLGFDQSVVVEYLDKNPGKNVLDLLRDAREAYALAHSDEPLSQAESNSKRKRP